MRYAPLRVVLVTQEPVPVPSTVPFLDSVAARWPTRDSIHPRLLAAGLAERRSCSRQSLTSPLTAAALRHSLLTAAPPPRRLRLEPQVLRKLPDLECYTNLRHYGIVAFGLFGVIFYFLGCLPFPSLPFPSLPEPSSVDWIDRFPSLPCLRPFRHTVRTICSL